MTSFRPMTARVFGHGSVPWWRRFAWCLRVMIFEWRFAVRLPVFCTWRLAVLLWGGLVLMAKAL